MSDKIARMLLLLAALVALALVVYTLRIGSPLWPERARSPVGLGLRSSQPETAAILDAEVFDALYC